MDCQIDQLQQQPKEQFDYPAVASTAASSSAAGVRLPTADASKGQGRAGEEEHEGSEPGQASADPAKVEAFHRARPPASGCPECLASAGRCWASRCPSWRNAP